MKNTQVENEASPEISQIIELLGYFLLVFIFLKKNSDPKQN